MSKKNCRANLCRIINSSKRVKEGVASPEFPDVTCEGWSGSIVEMTGKKSALKFVIEWDDETLKAMTEEYREQCEQNSLYYRMACFDADQIESVDE